MLRWRSVAVLVAFLTLLSPIAAQDETTFDSTVFLASLLAGTIECPPGMVRVDAFWGSFCIDQFEASRDDRGWPVSLVGRRPWTNITWERARFVCGLSGKRLCTGREWLAACDLRGQKYDLTQEGTAELFDCFTYCSNCTLEAASNHDTGVHSECRSGSDAYDMVGNVWEWTEETVPDHGWAGSERSVGDVLGKDPKRYGNDHIYPPIDGTGKGYPVRRGGSWSTISFQGAERAGCFSVHFANNGPDVRTGYRCCYGFDPSPLPTGTLADTLEDRNSRYLESMRQGIVLSSEERFQEALVAFNDARAISPASPEANNGRAVALAGRDRLDAAIAVVDSVLDNDPDDTYALANKGVFLIRAKRYEEAVNTYDLLLELVPGDERAIGNRAYALVTMVAEATATPSQAPSPEPTTEPTPTAEPTPSAEPSTTPAPTVDVVEPSLQPCLGHRVLCEEECVDLTSDPRNCGACGTSCIVPNAAVGCSGGVCSLIDCMPGYASCDLRRDTGCETFVRTDPENCGGCKRRCPAREACVDGTCMVLTAEPLVPAIPLEDVCEDNNPCTRNAGEDGACVIVAVGCGHSCGEGRVCDGDTECVQLSEIDGPCACAAMCTPGLTCTSSGCSRVISSCGDGRCEPGECSECPGDCSPTHCAGNGRCDTAVGETCATARTDCLCAQGLVCKPENEGALKNGCYEVACGDRSCDYPETAVGCCLDCPCPEGYDCHEATQMCMLMCGNGRCDEWECNTCIQDCGCDDCRCSFVVSMIDEVELSVGGDRELPFIIRNTGILQDTYSIKITSPIDAGWLGERTVRLDPGEDEELILHLHPTQAGTFTITVHVEDWGMHKTKEHAAKATVSRQGAMEQVLGGLAPILGLKDLAEIIIISVSLVFAGRRYLQYRRNLDAMSQQTHALNRMRTTPLHGGGQAYANRHY